MDALKTALTVGAGAAGAAAILLSLRRQWLNERGQQHLELDSSEKRVTELYAKASDQLGHDSAAVRLAGLYALERLAESHVAHRQTVLNVLCAYIRLGGSQPQPSDQEVRQTAQRIITSHLKWPDWETEQPHEHWANADLDLTGAFLDRFTLDSCRLRRALFDNATFENALIVRSSFRGEPWGTSGPTGVGGASFEGATFSGRTVFEDVIFEGDVSFEDARFDESVYFGGLRAFGRASFRTARFNKDVEVAGSSFRQCADFDHATFGGRISLGPDLIYAVGVTFEGGATFRESQFLDVVDFAGATFEGDVFGANGIARGVDLMGASVSRAGYATSKWPGGWVGSTVKGDVLKLEPVKPSSPPSPTGQHSS